MTHECGDFPGKSHSGFCQYYQKFASQNFTSDILSLKKQHATYDVVFAGHSLGAAAAMYAAYDVTISSKNAVQPKIYGFGQPRVGNHEFASAVASAVGDRIYRVVHRSDIVAHLPTCCSFIGSECGTSDKCPYHVAGEYWYNNDMSNFDDFKTCDGGEDASCSNTFDLSVDDHMHYYGVEVGDYCCY